MEAKVFKVALHAINEKETAMLDRAFRLSQHRPRAYKQTTLQLADIIISGSQGEKPRTNKPVLMISDKVPNLGIDKDILVIQRPLLPNRVLKSLDHITLKSLNYAPELDVGSSVEVATGIYSALKSSSKARSSSSPPSNNLNVLVVDDSSLVQKQMEIILSSISITADYATDGASAIMSHSKNNYDLIFMDVMMPGMDGFQTCKAIKKLRVTPPKIIMLTSKGSPINRAHGMLVGADAYLTKPANQESLSNAIKKVMGHKN